MLERYHFSVMTWRWQNYVAAAREKETHDGFPEKWNRVLRQPHGARDRHSGISLETAANMLFLCYLYLVL